MKGIYLIPSLIEKLSVSEMFEYYQSNIPSESIFSQQIQLRKRNWANKKNIPTMVSEFPEYIVNKYFPMLPKF